MGEGGQGVQVLPVGLAAGEEGVAPVAGEEVVSEEVGCGVADVLSNAPAGPAPVGAGPLPLGVGEAVRLTGDHVAEGLVDGEEGKGGGIGRREDVGHGRLLRQIVIGAGFRDRGVAGVTRPLAARVRWRQLGTSSASNVASSGSPFWPTPRRHRRRSGRYARQDAASRSRPHQCEWVSPSRHPVGQRYARAALQRASCALPSAIGQGPRSLSDVPVLPATSPVHRIATPKRRMRQQPVRSPAVDDETRADGLPSRLAFEALHGPLTAGAILCRSRHQVRNLLGRVMETVSPCSTTRRSSAK